MNKSPNRVAFGFCTHTGWAAMIAISGPPSSPAIVDRRRVEMIVGTVPHAPPYVYHAAQDLALGAADRFIRDAAHLSHAKAKAALATAIAELEEKELVVAASAIIVADRSLDSPLSAILKSHALIHAAEGALYRAAIRTACEGFKIPVVEIRARDLAARAASQLGVSVAQLPERLATIGRAAGKPWAKDQKDSFLAAILALANS